jgi:DNA-directed RNA polymerase subunit N
MLVPVRCFTCGFPISIYWEEYKSRLSKGESAEAILDSLNIKRYCCRRMFISTFEYIDEFLQYVKVMEKFETKPPPPPEPEIPKKRRGRRKKIS